MDVFKKNASISYQNCYQNIVLYIKNIYLPNLILKSPPTMTGGGDLLFLLSPPADAASTCFCSHSKTPTRIIFKYLQYAYWPWVIFQFLQQNPRWPPKSYGASWSSNRFIDLFYVWFKGKTLHWPWAEKLLVWFFSVILAIIKIW